jgi:hypothetical protein
MWSVNRHLPGGTWCQPCFRRDQGVGGHGRGREKLREGTWLSTRAWRRRIVTLVGVGLFTVGLFGLFVVVGPVGVKLLLIAAFLYAAAALAVGIARA